MADLQLGQVIDGKYRVVRELGRGGMGAVYEGVHELIHRRVAIKVLHTEVSRDETAASRFEREAQAAGRIGSPHIVEVLDLGSLASGARYMVMELLEGESLKQRLARNRHPAREAVVGWTFQLLEGVAAAHDKGIVHRDLKPDNVFLQRRDGRDFVKLLDFGISKFTLADAPTGLAMTSTGAVMGTPLYMSPEQARGSKNVDHRTDVYAVGVILYECLAGRVPFAAASFNELLFKIALEAPPPLQSIDPNVDAGLAAIVEKAMARDPAERFGSARELHRCLSDWAHGRSSLALAPAPLARTRPVGDLEVTGPAATVAESQTNRSWARSFWSAGDGQSASPWRLVALGVAAGLATVAVAAGAYLTWWKPSAPPGVDAAHLANLPAPASGETAADSVAPPGAQSAAAAGSPRSAAAVRAPAVTIVSPAAAATERPLADPADGAGATREGADDGASSSPSPARSVPAAKKRRSRPRKRARTAKARAKVSASKPKAPIRKASPPAPEPESGTRLRGRIIRTEL